MRQDALYVVGDCLDARIGMNDLFGRVFAGLVSMKQEIWSVESDILEERDEVATSLDSLRNDICTYKSEFDSLASNFDSHDLENELGWLKHVTEGEIELILDSESFSYDELLACDNGH